MKNIFLGFWFISILYCQCEDYDQLECSNSDSCNWVEDITQASCYYTFSSYSECIANGCLWYNPGTYGYMGSHCYGSYSVDNSYCEEVQMTECAEADYLQCNSNDNCDWIQEGDIEIGQCSEFDDSEFGCNNYSGECYWDEDITYGYCGAYPQGTCNSTPGCYWDCSSWYTWVCGCYGSEEIIDTDCVGEYEINNGYCTEAYELGDLNSDGSLNVLDIVELVDIILNDNSYSLTGDTNNDGMNNILDVILLVSIILGV